MTLTEERHYPQRETDKRERDAGRYRKENAKTTRAPDSQAEITGHSNHCHQNDERSAGHGPLAAI
jgi:hypothetical protein